MQVPFYIDIIYMKHLQQHALSNIFQSASKEQNVIWGFILIHAMQTRKRFDVSCLEFLNASSVFCSNTLRIFTCGLIYFQLLEIGN